MSANLEVTNFSLVEALPACDRGNENRMEPGASSRAGLDQIELVDADPQWALMFHAEARAVRAALDEDLSPEIHHVGSTAIRGLAAKPVIDMVLTLSPESDWPRLVAPLEALGYAYWADNPRADRMFFVKGMPPAGIRRTHHIHVRRQEEANAMLSFRDYLIGHPEAAARYLALKRRLATHYRADREAYTAAKEKFVEAILAVATPEA